MIIVDECKGLVVVSLQYRGVMTIRPIKLVNREIIVPILQVVPGVDRASRIVALREVRDWPKAVASMAGFTPVCTVTLLHLRVRF